MPEGTGKCHPFPIRGRSPKVMSSSLLCQEIKNIYLSKMKKYSPIYLQASGKSNTFASRKIRVIGKNICRHTHL